MSDYKKGNALNVFYHNGESWRAFAHSQNNSLSTSSETNEISSKDFGIHNEQEVTGFTWSMSGEYLFTPADADIIIAMQLSGKQYSFCFAQVSQEENWADGLQPVTSVGSTEAWTPGSVFVKYGNAIVTSAEISANNGEVATVSLEITGSGSLTKTAPTGNKLLSYTGE